MPTDKPGFSRGLTLFTAGYLVLAGAVAVFTGNGEFTFYIVFMLLLIGAVALVHRRVGLSPGLLWCLSGWGFVHMAGGLVPVPASWPVNGPHAVLYSLWLIPERLKYDQVVHAYGFAVTTWLCWQGLSAVARGQGVRLRPTAGPLVLCAAAGMGFGALNEVVEFIATISLPETNVGGYINTGWDLVANLVGCTVAAVAIRVGDRRAVAA